MKDDKRYRVLTNGKTQIVVTEKNRIDNKEIRDQLGFKIDESPEASLKLLNMGVAHTEDYQKLEKVGMLKEKLDEARAEKPLDTDAPKTQTPKDEKKTKKPEKAK